jgi:proline iminopeptidase
VALYVEGSGLPIVLLQGGPGFTSRSVAPIVDLLRDQFRVIRFEHAGWTVDGLLDHMDAVRASVGEESWFVLGHSWGAAIASLYAAAHPERVRGLVLANPLEISSGFFEPADDTLFGGIEPFAEEHDPDVADMLWEDLESTCPDARGEGYDLTPFVRRIAAPALVLLGGRDAIDRRSGKLWAELANAQVVSLADAGHWPFLERPEEFRRAVTEFLMTHAGRRAVAAA